MWEPIITAPFSRFLELAVLDQDGAHPLISPCERALEGWRHAITGLRVDVDPTHSRHWGEGDEEA